MELWKLSSRCVVLSGDGIGSADLVFGMSSGRCPCENQGRVSTYACACTSIKYTTSTSYESTNAWGGILAVVEIFMHICLQVNLHWANLRCKWDMRWIACWSIKCSNTSNSRAVQGSDPGGQDGSRKEMRMDDKWIPAARRVAAWKSWSSRGRELAGFKSWFEHFSGWYCLIHDSFGPELRGVRLSTLSMWFSASFFAVRCLRATKVAGGALQSAK